MKITISIIKIFKNHLFQNTVGVKDSGFEKTAFDMYFTYHDLKNEAESSKFTSLVSQPVSRRNEETQHRQGTFAISGPEKTAGVARFKKPACKLWEWDLYRLLNQNRPQEAHFEISGLRPRTWPEYASGGSF